MADSKISDLSAMTAAIVPGTDVLEIEDISAGASGSLKLTPQGLFGSLGGPGIGGLLSLSSGNPDYRPDAFYVTPASTDTSAETVTFTNPHGLTLGTMVTTDVTAGGLTVGTTYFVIVASSTAISFATTFANAKAGTKINLTANITGNVIGFGVQNDKLYLAPWLSSIARISDGTRINAYNYSEVPLDLTGLLTAGSLYDFFADISGGAVRINPTPTVWASFGAGTSQRVTALDMSLGWPTLSGDATKLYLGTARAVLTDTIESSRGYDDFTAGAAEYHGRRFLWSMAGYAAGRRRGLGAYCGITHALAAGSYTLWRAASVSVPVNTMEFVLGLPDDLYPSLQASMRNGLTGYANAGLGLNETTGATYSIAQVQAAAVLSMDLGVSRSVTAPAGYNYIAAKERALTATANMDAMVMQMQCPG